MTETIYRTCNLCEALCGLKFDVEGDEIVSVGSDKADVFSRGYACPKGMVYGKLATDPDRLQTPVVKNAQGEFEPIGWSEAIDLAIARLKGIRATHGKNAIALYQGNPSGHQHGSVLTTNGLYRALDTRNLYNASSQDTNPRFAVSYLLYGASLVIPIPDIDRTDYFLCIGANPLVSNGSLMTAPNMRKRVRDVRRRGGKVVVVDPCLTETAKHADWHLPVKPGGDAALLLSMLHVLEANGRIDAAQVNSMADGWQAIRGYLAHFPPEQASQWCGIPAGDIESLALEFADAPSAACYTRVGVCLNEHATLATWAGDLLNIVTGNLGRAGGAMFPTPLMDLAALNAQGDGEGIGRWGSRVRNLPEVMGVLPTTALADEIETPGDGQVRAFITLMGNPVLSAPNGKRLDAALSKLDFMVCVDAYINETTRHADLILPSAHSLTQDSISVMYPMWSVRNVARWSPAVLQQTDGQMAAWEVLVALSEGLGGGPTGSRFMDGVIRLMTRFGVRWTPTKMAAFLIRMGPFGNKFNPFRKGLSLKEIQEHPHGLDLGPMREGVGDRVFLPGGRVQLAPPRLLEGLADYVGALGDSQVGECADEQARYPLQLIGRRELRSNNSWMHNMPELMTGEHRCTLWMHPQDARDHGVEDGQTVLLENALHSEVVPLRITDDIRRGVVSMPHGYGHKNLGQWQKTASRHAGVSFNDWAGDDRVESVVAQSILNGIPVSVRSS